MLHKYLLISIAIIILTSSCSNEFDGKDGVKTVYFPNSKIVQQIVEYKDGKRIGELKEFYRNGKLKVRQYYKNDTLNDSAFFYHENGKLKYFQYMKDFKKNGTWKKYNEDGKVYEEINFKDDYLNGYSTTYTYRSGKVLKKLHYEDGMKEGKQEFFHNNGKPKAITYFYHNKPTIGTEEWDERGEKIDHSFQIYVKEKNRLLLENKLEFIVKLEKPHADDEVYCLISDNSDKILKATTQLEKRNDEFILEYNIGIGGFVMEDLIIGAYRKTSMGNTFIQTKTITISANNY